MKAKPDQKTIKKRNIQEKRQESNKRKRPTRMTQNRKDKHGKKRTQK